MRKTLDIFYFSGEISGETRCIKMAFNCISYNLYAFNPMKDYSEKSAEPCPKKNRAE